MISINFTSSKDNDEKRLMQTKSEKIEIMIKDKTDKVTEEPFHHLPSKYQIDLELTMKGSSFIFDHVHCCITNVIK